MWTRFMDMHSGGDQKTKWAYWYIEAPAEKAELVFYNLAGFSPHRVSCTCCGEDFSLDESPTLAQATAFNRGCAFDRKKDRYVEKPADKPFLSKHYQKLSDYLKSEGVRVIYKKDIKPEWLEGELPTQGYVWQD